MLDLDKLDPYVLQVLYSTGWSPTRTYNTNSVIASIENLGYPCFDYAKRVLDSLGGLIINDKGNENHQGAQFDFNPFDAIDGYCMFNNTKEVIGDNIFPLGTMCAAIVFVAENKNIYWVDGKQINWIGGSIEDYLNNLFCKEIKSRCLLKIRVIK